MVVYAHFRHACLSKMICWTQPCPAIQQTSGIALMTLATYMANGYNAHYDVTTIAIASYSYSNHGLWYSDMHWGDAGVITLLACYVLANYMSYLYDNISSCHAAVLLVVNLLWLSK